MDTFILTFCLFTLTIASSVNIAKSNPATNTANAISIKFSEYFSYYMYTQVCVSKSDLSAAAAIVQGSIEAQNKSLNLSYLMRKAANMSDAAMQARLKLVTENMKNQINSGCQNIDVLIGKYGFQCKAMLENPADAFNAESHKKH